MTESIRRAAGSLLVVGIESEELTAIERAWLKLIQPAGIVLFRRNIVDAKQTRALLADSIQFCAPHSVAFVDVEGGTVDRLRDALAPIPSAQAVAQAARAKRKPALSREHGELIARAVKAFGFNSSLAPVLDLGLPESQPVMQTRCASPSPSGVVEYARAFLAGLSEHGVAGCGKHFPGLGGGALDSHLETPFIRRSWRQLWQEDLDPYRALRNRLPMVMVNHAAYPLTKDRKHPASVSSFWIDDVLRKRIDYRGIIVSDDLEMGGIAHFKAIPHAAVETVCRGSEILLICHHPEPILSAYEALIAEGERSAAFCKLLFARARESARKRSKAFPSRMPPALSQRHLATLRTRIIEFSDAIAKDAPSPEIPPT